MSWMNKLLGGGGSGGDGAPPEIAPPTIAGSGEPEGTPWDEETVDEMFPESAEWAKRRE